MGGYQPDLSNDGWTGALYEERGRGMLALRGEAAVVAPDGSRTVARFADDRENITPIFSTLPPAESLSRPDGPHSGNPHVRAAVLERKEKQHLMWTYQRGTLPGRGFGMTGAHYHWNWAHPEFRTAVLNAIVWITGMDVPEGGIRTPAVTLEDLLVNQDYEPGNFNLEPWIKRIDAWTQRP